MEVNDLISWLCSIKRSQQTKFRIRIIIARIRISATRRKTGSVPVLFRNRARIRTKYRIRILVFKARLQISTSRKIKNPVSQFCSWRWDYTFLFVHSIISSPVTPEIDIIIGVASRCTEIKLTVSWGTYTLYARENRFRFLVLSLPCIVASKTV